MGNSFCCNSSPANHTDTPFCTCQSWKQIRSDHPIPILTCYMICLIVWCAVRLQRAVGIQWASYQIRKTVGCWLLMFMFFLFRCCCFFLFQINVLYILPLKFPLEFELKWKMVNETGSGVVFLFSMLRFGLYLWSFLHWMFNVRFHPSLGVKSSILIFLIRHDIKWWSWNYTLIWSI